MNTLNSGEEGYGKSQAKNKGGGGRRQIWVGIKRGGGEWCEGRRGNIEGQERVGEGEEGK
jgi:hypothetical protein